MLNPTTHELIFIRICVVLIRYAPLFELFLPLPFSILALLLEAVHYFFIIRRFETRLASPAEHPHTTREERRLVFERCLQNIPDPDKYLSLWSLRADPAEIKKENIRDFLRWAFFDRQDAGSDDIHDELDEYVTKTEELIGRPLAPGRGGAKPMRLSFDPVQSLYHSVFWHITIGLVDSVTHLRMRWGGFKFHATSLLANIFHVFPPRPLAALERARKQSPSEQLSYWYRPAVGGSATTLPIVFLHGIGIGLWPYVPFLSDLPPTGPVLAVEILPICMRLTKTNILARPDFLRHFKDILRQHGIDRFVLVGHSYGSVLTTQVLHDTELGPQVEAVVLIDPVTLLLHLPDVAYNFTRRMPRTANEWQLWYVASMDPGIALVLGRHFFWRENVIWKDELVSGGRKAAVCLASRDLIVDTLSVARYLVYTDNLTDLARRKDLAGDLKLAETLEKGGTTTESGVELLWFKMDHAQAFDRREDYGRVLDVVRRFCTYP